MRSALVLVLAALAAAACTPENGPLMAPNQDCLACHAGGGEGPTWTVAGTFGGKGSRIVVTDATGWSFTLRAAENGNFYTAESVVFPITVSVDGVPMADSSGTVIPIRKYASCNICHGPGGVSITGENMAPGSDCLMCHDGSVAETVFTVAGTWRGPGRTVRVTGGGRSVTMTTNTVGNFFTSEPVTFGGTAAVDGETMDELPHGSCNRCHGNGGEAGGD